MAESNETPVVRQSFWDDFDPFRDFFRNTLSTRPGQGLWSDRSPHWSPAINVSEGEKSYVVTVELPGASKNDIHVECHEHVLTIKGEKRNEREEHNEQQHFIERSYGSFRRSFRLPNDASEEIKANLRDGVLTVEVAKTEAEKPRVVSIEG